MSDNDLRPIDDFDECTQPLVSALREGDPGVCLEALEDLGEVDDELAGELLRVVGCDGNELLRAAAAIALGPTLEVCQLALGDDGRLEDSEWGGAPLSQETYDSVVEGLRLVHSDTSARTLVRRRVLEASVRSPRPWHLEAIREAWASTEEDWRMTAVFAMGYFHQHDFSAEIEAAFRSSSRALRQEAMLAASQRGLERLTPEIRRIAADRRAPSTLRYAAVEALGMLGDEEDLDLLNELMGSSDQDLAAVAELSFDNVTMLAEVELLGGEEWDEEIW